MQRRLKCDTKLDLIKLFGEPKVSHNMRSKVRKDEHQRRNAVARII